MSCGINIPFQLCRLNNAWIHFTSCSNNGNGHTQLWLIVLQILDCFVNLLTWLQFDMIRTLLIYLIASILFSSDTLQKANFCKPTDIYPQLFNSHKFLTFCVFSGHFYLLPSKNGFGQFSTLPWLKDAKLFLKK